MTLTLLILIGLGVLVVLIGLPRARLWVGTLALPGPLPPFPKLPRPSRRIEDWFDIDADNVVYLYSPKIEVGQGNHTLIAQLAAAVLGLDPDQIRVHQPDSARGAKGLVNVTGGSASVMMVETELRQAASTLKTNLIRVAALHWACTPDTIRVERGLCIATSGETLRFADLFAEARRLPQPETPALPPATDLPLIGRAWPRLDLADKVTGRTVFGADIHLPNMAYGAVVRPPRERARLVRVLNAEAVRSLPGVVAVVVERGFVGVVARKSRQAHDAARALVCTWADGSTCSDEDLSRLLALKPGRAPLIQDEGGAPAFSSTDTISAEYWAHMVAPLPFEPPVSTVEVHADGATVYAATQSLHFVRSNVAKALKLPEDKVRVIITHVGGSFARKHGAVADPSADAARLARAAGRPVQVAWSLQDDLRYGIKRPPTHCVLRATLTPAGRIQAFESNLAATDGSTVFPPQDKIPLVTGIDAASAIGSQPLYSGIPQRQTRYRHVAPPFLTSFFRAPGISSNVFATEGFTDELAHRAGADPLTFRLAHLGHDELNRRLRAVLEQVRIDSGWDQAPPAGRARGVACYAYGNAVCAMVVEVERRAERAVVIGVFACVEAGIIVNPDVSRSQIEGAVALGLSWAAHEHLHLKDGLVTNASLKTYALLKPSMAPEVRVTLLPSAVFRQGLNEIGAGLIAAALGNALFSLTGIRQRRTPLDLNRL